MSALDTNIRRALAILLPKIQALHESTSRPIVLGITGLQGSGKSTWASTILNLLTTEHHLRACTISLDDLYNDHDGLVARRNKDADNKIYRTRGHPGTHDEVLAARFFADLRDYRGDGKLRIPSYDKSKFNGEGDRAPESDWPSIDFKPDVVVFEGWCIGFRPLCESQIREKYDLAIAGRLPVNTPAKHNLDHLLELNESLQRYCDAFMGPQHFDFMLHIDTEDVRNVYVWRLEQEHEMIKAKGMGMTDEQVEAFIDGYMPGYELYLDGLRSGFFGSGKKGRQVRIVLDRSRAIVGLEEL